MEKNNIVNIEALANLDRGGVSLSWACLFDVLLIVFMFFALASKFIISTGATINLNAENDINLPISINSNMQGVLTSQELSVLHIQSENMILFEGDILNMDNFARALKQRGDLSQEVLLVKIDKDCDMQTFFNICEIAQGAGFKSVQIASMRAK